MFLIWDLDGTLIDSNHRKATLPDGSLDLAHWFENNTPEKIAKDTLLPLINPMRKLAKRQGIYTMICTARHFQAADWHFLTRHNIPYDAVLHREAGDMRPDAEMKLDYLRQFFGTAGFPLRGSKIMMIDDNQSVLRTLALAGITCFDAVKLNDRLA